MPVDDAKNILVEVKKFREGRERITDKEDKDIGESLKKVFIKQFKESIANDTFPVVATSFRVKENELYPPDVFKDVSYLFNDNFDKEKATVPVIAPSQWVKEAVREHLEAMQEQIYQAYQNFHDYGVEGNTSSLKNASTLVKNYQTIWEEAVALLQLDKNDNKDDKQQNKEDLNKENPKEKNITNAELGIDGKIIDGKIEDKEKFAKFSDFLENYKAVTTILVRQGLMSKEEQIKAENKMFGKKLNGLLSERKDALQDVKGDKKAEEKQPTSADDSNKVEAEAKAKAEAEAKAKAEAEAKAETKAKPKTAEEKASAKFDKEINQRRDKFLKRLINLVPENLTNKDEFRRKVEDGFNKVVEKNRNKGDKALNESLKNLEDSLLKKITFTNISVAKRTDKVASQKKATQQQKTASTQQTKKSPSKKEDRERGGK